jgi:hypothetical protein
MKRNLALILLIAFSLNIQAAPPFRGQPLMATAYEKLETALRKLERANSSGKEAPLDAAALDLTVAKQSLENAKKNKGASRSAAIKLIEEAMPLVEARPVTEDNLAGAKGKITEAMERVLKGAKVGH